MANDKEKPPHEIFLDLLMDNLQDYIEYIGKIKLFANRPRMIGDQSPAIYSILDSSEPQQRGIPHGKKVLDRVLIRVEYYTYDMNKLWSAYQTIKEIIVGNNKVQDTSQFTDSKIEWSMLKGATFDYLYVDEEVLLGKFTVLLQAVYDESYL